MSAAVVTAMMLLHLAFWIVQIMANQITGAAADCTGVSTFARGTPVLDDISRLSSSTQGINGLVDLGRFLTSALLTVVSSIVRIVFFDYEWLSGGGQVVDMVVAVIKIMLGAVLMGALLRLAGNFLSSLRPF